MSARKIAVTITWLLFSPTRWFIDWWKTRDDSARGNRLRAWSLGLFALEATGAVVFSLSLPSAPAGAWTIMGVLALLWAWSRVNEIGYAFYRDALSAEKKSDLTASERIQMAMRSFFGLGFNFALFYYFLPAEKLFNRVLTGFWEAFYFSGVTLATLGYGDIFPTHPASQFLTLWEVATGILIIAIAVATYAGRSDA